MLRLVLPHGLLEPVAFPLHQEGIAIMENAVEYCRRGHVVVKDVTPFLERPVRGDNDRSLLVPPRYELEEERCRLFRYGQVPRLVDDEKAETVEGLRRAGTNISS